MLADIHLHSRFSFDSNEKLENYIIEAQKRNINFLGFSEHYDYDAVLDGADIAVCDIPNYIKAVEDLKKTTKFPQILCGIEFGYRREAINKYVELQQKYQFDYVINSVHTLPDRGDCFHEQFFVGRTLKESYREYFKAVLESVNADYDFDIVGHIGYVSRYRTEIGSSIRYSDYSDILDEILKSIISRGKCLEINTSSGKATCDWLPDCDVIEKYLYLGGNKLSFGSDAHRACDFLRKSDKLISYLKSIGVCQLFYYKERKPVSYKI